MEKNQQLLRTMCNHVSFNDFKVLASSNPEFHLKIKKSLPTSRDQPILKDFYHYICLISYSFKWLFSYYQHSYIAIYFLSFSVIKYAPVSFKIVLKICL